MYRNISYNFQRIPDTQFRFITKVDDLLGQPSYMVKIVDRNSPRAHNRFNKVVEAKRFEGVFLCRKVCCIQKSNS